MKLRAIGLALGLGVLGACGQGRINFYPYSMAGWPSVATPCAGPGPTNWTHVWSLTNVLTVDGKPNTFSWGAGPVAPTSITLNGVAITNPYTAGIGCASSIAVTYPRSYYAASDWFAALHWHVVDSAEHGLDMTTWDMQASGYASCGYFSPTTTWMACRWSSDSPMIYLLRTSPSLEVPHMEGPIVVPVPPPNTYPPHITPPKPLPGLDMGIREAQVVFPVEGSYGDTYTAQSKISWNSAWTERTNIVATTNNVVVYSNAIAFLTGYVPINGDTNQQSYFITGNTEGQPAASIFAGYAVAVPGNSGRPIGAQLVPADRNWTMSSVFTNLVCGTNVGGPGSASLYVGGSLVTAGVDSSGNWSSAGTNQLLLGKGALYWNSNANPVSVAVYGFVQRSWYTNALPAGYSYCSYPLPRPCDLWVDGFPGVEGDRVYKWSTTSNAWVTYTYSWTNRVHPVLETNVNIWITNWWGPSRPRFDVGEAFVVWKSTATNWVTHMPHPGEYEVSVAGLTNCDRVVVTCPINGVLHTWTNGQNTLTLCAEDNLFLTVPSDTAATHSSAWTVATMTVVDHTGDSDVTSNFDLTLAGNGEMANLYQLDTPTLLSTNLALTKGPGVQFTNYPPGALYISELQVCATNVIVTLGGVLATNRVYSVYQTDDPSSGWWLNMATVQPQHDGYVAVLIPRDAAAKFYRASWLRLGW